MLLWNKYIFLALYSHNSGVSNVAILTEQVVSSHVTPDMTTMKWSWKIMIDHDWIMISKSLLTMNRPWKWRSWTLRDDGRKSVLVMSDQAWSIMISWWFFIVDHYQWPWSIMIESWSIMIDHETVRLGNLEDRYFSASKVYVSTIPLIMKYILPAWNPKWNMKAFAACCKGTNHMASVNSHGSSP